MTAKDSFLFSKDKNALLSIVFSDPSSRNALGVDQVEFLVEEILKSQPRAILFTNASSVFCAGGNLKDYAKLQSKAEGLIVNQKIRSAFQKLSQLSVPKAALVDGHCFGGGIEFLSLFDFIVATPSSYFGLWQRKNGLSFGWGGRSRLESKISSSQVREWYISASLKSAYQARDIGLLQSVALRDRGLKMSQDWLNKSLRLRSQTLELFDDQSKGESEVFDALWGNEDHQKSLAGYGSDQETLD